MFQAFIKGDCANEALQTTIKYKIVIDKGAEHSFFFVKIIKKEIDEVSNLKFDENLTLLQAAKSLKNMHPYVSRLLIIRSSVWVSTSTAERFFSQLNLIENYLRTKMMQERLSNIAIILMNGSIQVNVDDVIDEFVKNDRKVYFE